MYSEVQHSESEKWSLIGDEWGNYYFKHNEENKHIIVCNGTQPLKLEGEEDAQAKSSHLSYFLTRRRHFTDTRASLSKDASCLIKKPYYWVACFYTLGMILSSTSVSMFGYIYSKLINAGGASCIVSEAIFHIINGIIILDWYLITAIIFVIFFTIYLVSLIFYTITRMWIYYLNRIGITSARLNYECIVKETSVV